MKRFTFLPLTALALALCADNAAAQGRSIDGNGFDSDGVKIIPKTDPKKAAKKVKTVQLVAISPERVWKSADKKQNPIIGSLLAFERDAKTGKVLMIRDEKVRLLVGKKDFTLPISKLSADDQTYIRKLEDSARITGKLIEPAKKKEKQNPKRKPKSPIAVKDKEKQKPQAKDESP